MLGRQITITLLSALSVAACGGSVSSQPGGGGASDEPAGQRPSEGTAASSPSQPGNVASFVALVSPESSLCLPEALAVDGSGAATCTLVEALSDAKDVCSLHPGRVEASAGVASIFRTAESLDPTVLVCEIPQIDVAAGASCESSDAPGWCYVTGEGAAPACAQALRFTKTGQPTAGALVGIACNR